MAEERVSVRYEIQKDLANFSRTVQPEINYLLDKYRPKEIELDYGGGASEVKIKLIFE